MSYNKPAIIVFGVVILAIIGLFFLLMMSPDEENPIVEREVSIPLPPLQPIPEPISKVGSEEPKERLTVEDPADESGRSLFVLPLLGESDQLIRDGVVSLARHEGINAWLASNQLIRKFVALVDNVARGQIVKEPVRFLAPEGPFLANRIDDESYVLDPASFKRFDIFAEVIQSVDARRAAEFYQLLRPLFNEAYTELGYGNVNFDDVIFNAIGRLLETPVIDDDVRLRRPVVMFEYEDRNLENLSPVQKQMIRMGPRNTRIMQAKIARVAIELRTVLGR